MSFFTDLQQEASNSTAENTIIDFLIKRPNEVVEMTMEDFAVKTFSSRSTIFRFCKKHGLKGFNDLKTQIAVELNLNLKDSETRVGSLPFLLEDDPKKIIYKSKNNSILSIVQTVNSNEENSLIATAKKISSAKDIVFIGVEFSGIVAKDSCIHFAKIGKRCQHYIEGFEILNYAKYAKASDLVFFVSYSGTTNIIVEAAKLVKQKNATMISITGNSKNTLSELCSTNLYVNSNDCPNNNLSLTSRLSSLCIMDIIYCLVLSIEKDTISKHLVHSIELFERPSESNEKN